MTNTTTAPTLSHLEMLTGCTVYYLEDAIDITFKPSSFEDMLRITRQARARLEQDGSEVFFVSLDDEAGIATIGYEAA
jgi:hypothetical protein